MITIDFATQLFGARGRVPFLALLSPVLLTGCGLVQVERFTVVTVQVTDAAWRGQNDGVPVGLVHVFEDARLLSAVACNDPDSGEAVVRMRADSALLQFGDVEPLEGSLVATLGHKSVGCDSNLEVGAELWRLDALGGCADLGDADLLSIANGPILARTATEVSPGQSVCYRPITDPTSDGFEPSERPDPVIIELSDVDLVTE